MAFVAGNRVRVADASTQWRGHSGEVVSVDGTAYEVRLDGHACGKTVRLLEPQLRTEARAAPYDYSNCAP